MRSIATGSKFMLCRRTGFFKNRPGIYSDGNASIKESFLFSYVKPFVLICGYEKKF
jgi:hypothetical protein